MSSQMLLPLAHDMGELTFDNFFPGPNKEVVNHLQAMLAATDLAATDKAERVIYLVGSPASGRSHLLQACCQQFLDASKSAMYLSLRRSQALRPECLQDLESMRLICIDDVDDILSGGKGEGESEEDHRAWAEALFHLYNRAADSGSLLVMAASSLPHELNCLPDLQSRLSWGLVLQLKPLDDDEKIKALARHAESRGLDISQDVLQFLLRHYTRDMGELYRYLLKLDEACWQKQRRVTVPFLKKVLL